MWSLDTLSADKGMLRHTENEKTQSNFIYMRYVLLTLIFVSTVASIGFAAAPRPPITKEAAIEIARAYIKKQSPNADISQRSPTAEFFANAPAHGGSIWTIGFGVPAPSDSKTGNTVGVRPFISPDVWVHPDGTVEGSVSHTP